MALGALERSGADIAWPSPASRARRRHAGKPVGTVWLAWPGGAASPCTCRRGATLQGRREAVRRKSVAAHSAGCSSCERRDPLAATRSPRRRRGTAAFFALWPDEALRARLVASFGAAAQAAGGRAVPAANLHVTLEFLAPSPRRASRSSSDSARS